MAINNGFDFQRLFKDYKDDLNDLRQFAKEIFDFLEELPTPAP